MTGRVFDFDQKRAHVGSSCLRHGAKDCTHLLVEKLSVLKSMNPVEPYEVLRRPLLLPTVRGAREYQGSAAIVAVESVMPPLAPELPPRICGPSKSLDLRVSRRIKAVVRRSFDALAADPEALCSFCVLVRTRQALATVLRVCGDPGKRTFQDLCPRVASPECWLVW